MSGQVPPFVIAVLANFSGVPAATLPKLKDRRFVTMTRESFSRFLAHVRPRLTPAVRSDAAPGGVLKLELTFERLEDFLPQSVRRRLQGANAIEPDHAERVAGALAGDEAFQSLCGAWLGLKYLVDSQAENHNVKVKVLDVSKRDLTRDLQKAAEFDQSIIFCRIYSEGIGTFGGEAVGCVVGDYYLTAGGEDADLAEKVSPVAAAAGAPFLCAAHPGLLGAANWREVGTNFSPHSNPEGRLDAWQRRAGWSDRGAPFLFLPRVWPLGEPLGAGGTWPSEPTVHRRTGTWLNPAFLVARVVADAFGAPSLMEIARRLFPPGPEPQDAASDKVSGHSEGSMESLAGPPHGESEGLDVEYECDFPEEISNHLAEFGLNALSKSRVARRDLLQSLISVAPVSPTQGRPDLAQVLLCCTIRNRLHEYLRTKKRSVRGAELLEAARVWLAENLSEESGCPRLHPFDQVSVTGAGGNIRIQFSFLPAICAPKRSTGFSLHIRQTL